MRTGAVIALTVLLATALAPAPAPAASAAPVAVETAALAPVVEELRLTGTLTSPHTSRLASAVAGRIADLAVDAGALVDEGAVLVRLDDELASLELVQARAAEREAVTDLADAERRLGEAQQLASSRSFAETEVRDRAAAVERARAVLERRRAAAAFSAALVARHTLRAPFAGVIARRDADLGEWVTPDDPVLELVAIDRLRLDIRVPQKYFSRLQRGTPVAVQVDAGTPRSFDATVSDVVPVGDPGTRTFLVRADVDNAERVLVPGMSARAVIRLGTGREGVVVPRDALIRYPDGRTVVWVVGGSGDTRTVSARRVETGLLFGRSVEVSAGLDAGTDVVTRGNESLREGQEVRLSAPR